jgi:hypothetical protein
MKKQTAVEWLEKQLQKEEYIEKFGCVTYIINQAKEMEKQQIIDARNNGYESTYNSCESGCMGSMIIEGSHEQYYNQTYNNENTNND